MSNPWPAPEPDEDPRFDWLTWELETRSALPDRHEVAVRLHATKAMTVECRAPRLLHLRLRIPNARSTDPREIFIRVKEVLDRVEDAFGLETVNGLKASKWFLLRRE